MNVLDLVLGILKARGTWALGIWIALCGITAFVYRTYGGSPLASDNLRGMAFAYAIVVLVGWQLSALWARHRRRLAAAGSSTSSDGSVTNGTK